MMMMMSPTMIPMQEAVMMKKKPTKKEKREMRMRKHAKMQETRSKPNISNETTRNICRAIERGLLTRKTAATLFNVKYSTMCAILNKFENENSHEFQPKGRTKKLDQNSIEALKSWIAEDPKLTLTDLVNKVSQIFGITIDKSTIGRYVHSFKNSMKGPSMGSMMSGSGGSMVSQEEYHHGNDHHHSLMSSLSQKDAAAMADSELAALIIGSLPMMQEENDRRMG